MINKIVVKGYKSIKEQAVELLPINILIGGNGIGKSKLYLYFYRLYVTYMSRTCKTIF